MPTKKPLLKSGLYGGRCKTDYANASFTASGCRRSVVRLSLALKLAFSQVREPFKMPTKKTTPKEWSLWWALQD